MLRRIERLIQSIFTKIVIFVYAVFTFSFADCMEDVPPLLAKAKAVFQEVHSGKACSSYSHQNRVLYEMNCYGFINHLIQETSPEALKEIMVAMEQLKEEVPPSVDGMPCPFNYAAALQRQKLKHWEVLKEIEEVKPGDLLIYLPVNFEPKEHFDFKKRPPRIHMMVVETVFPKSDNLFHFSIIDCTRIPHNKSDDSRYPKQNGVGRSSVFLEKKEGHYALQWKPSGEPLIKEIIFARIKLN